MNGKRASDDVLRILIAGIDPVPDTIMQIEEVRRRGDLATAVALASRRWNAAQKALATDMEFWRGVWELCLGALTICTAPIPKRGQEREFRNQAEIAKGHFAASSQAFANADCPHGSITASLAQGQIYHLTGNRVEAQCLYEESQRLCRDASRRCAYRGDSDKCGIYENLDWRIRGWMMQLHESDWQRLIREIDTSPVGPFYTLGEDDICQTQWVAIDDQKYRLVNHQNRHGKDRLSLLPATSYFIVNAPDDGMAAIEPDQPQIDIHRGDRLLATKVSDAHPQANGPVLPPENAVGVFRLPNGRTVLRTARIWDNLVLLEPTNPRYGPHVLPAKAPRFSTLGSVVAILEKTPPQAEDERA